MQNPQTHVYSCACHALNPSSFCVVDVLGCIIVFIFIILFIVTLDDGGADDGLPRVLCLSTFLTFVTTSLAWLVRWQSPSADLSSPIALLFGKLAVSEFVPVGGVLHPGLEQHMQVTEAAACLGETSEGNLWGPGLYDHVMGPDNLSPVAGAPFHPDVLLVMTIHLGPLFFFHPIPLFPFLPRYCSCLPSLLIMVLS